MSKSKSKPTGFRYSEDDKKELTRIHNLTSSRERSVALRTLHAKTGKTMAALKQKMSKLGTVNVEEGTVTTLSGREVRIPIASMKIENGFLIVTF